MFILLGALIVVAALWMESNNNERYETVMAKLSTLAGTLAAIESTLGKVKLEVEKLKESLGDVEIPADAQDSLTRLTALSAALDELNPDEPTTPAPEPAPTEPTPIV